MSDKKEQKTNEEEEAIFPLWSDDPAKIDLLSFCAIAATVVDAVLDESLDPVALGLSGSWGSGKTTVLGLVRQELESINEDESKVLVVSTDPWRYDPTTGVKETLINEVLDCIRNELEENKSAKGQALGLLGKLANRVDWARAIRLATKTSLTLQLPSFDDVLKLVKANPESAEAETAVSLEAFREDFSNLMSSEELAHIRCVVVLVDDLDRCLPETVIETLETIRLFLAVPKMSFVIAADEDRVADAIRTRFNRSELAAGANESQEEPARLYLHKIVQTTVPLPALSRFDTEAYLFLLQLLTRIDAENAKSYVDHCAELRRDAGCLDELQETGDLDINQELLFANRLTPILYEKLQGNPRRIKRFLNDLHVRQAIAARRGIVLETNIVAKLMVLEVLIPDAFKKVLDWLARNELRVKITALESAAGRVPSGDKVVKTAEISNGTPEKGGKSIGEDEEFDDELIRWAKLPPALSDIDLGPYLYLAAAFSGKPLLASELPERLRDIASNLLSSVRAEQKSVSDTDIDALGAADALDLARYLGRAARDRPTEQRQAVLGLLRITRQHKSVIDEASELLAAIPVEEIEPATVLSFTESDVKIFKTVLEDWGSKVSNNPTKNAIKEVLKSEVS